MVVPRLRESLTLVLLALLPFHALLVTVLTKVIAGPGHAPIAALAIWKEALLGVILLIACVEIMKKWLVASDQWLVSLFDIFDYIIIGLIFLSLALLATNHQSLATFAFGAKYDLLPPIAFLILRRVSWSDHFQSALLRILIAVGCIVATYGILAEFLPLGFFTWLGYSDLHSLYVAHAPLAPYQELEGGMMRRAQSFMSGPNQLGLWLLIPLGVLLSQGNVGEAKKWKHFARMAIIFLALLYTFSRAAWIAAAVMMIFIFVRSTVAVHAKKLCVVILGFVACFAIALTLLFPSVFFRIHSSSDHIRKLVEAVQILISHPFGLGLGSAGPASNRFSDTCVALPKDSDWSWANNRQDLCIFVDDVQVQPADRTCSCPLLTENWYLQIGVELGVLGFALYVLLTILVLKRLLLTTTHQSLTTFLSFLGLSVAALFLHAFEDSAVAYTIWILIAQCLPKIKK